MGRDDSHQRGPVLYVLNRFPRLTETYVLRELLELEAAGDRILVDSLLPRERRPRRREVRQLRASIRYLPRRPKLSDREVAAAHARVAVRAPLTWLRLARRARRDPRAWRRFLKAGMSAFRARRQGVRHIHAHFVTAATEVARDAATLAKVPVTVTAHAKDIFHSSNAPHLIERLEGVSGVVTVSEHNVRHLQGLLNGVPVHHVPNGVPLAPSAPPAPDGPVLFVGRLVPKKGIDVLIDACALLPRDLGNLSVEVIGGGELAEELAARARRAGVADRVRFLGPRPSKEVEAAFRRCSMLALPCRIDDDGDRDGIPTVLVEALARGVPVISTELVGIPELVHHERTGLLVPPEDPPALGEAIARLAREPELARELGARGRELVAERFDPKRSARLLAAVLEGSS